MIFVAHGFYLPPTNGGFKTVCNRWRFLKDAPWTLDILLLPVLLPLSLPFLQEDNTPGIRECEANVKQKNDFPTKKVKLKIGELDELGWCIWSFCTLPETNVAPKKRPSPKEIHLQTIDFQGRTVGYRKGIW